MLKKDPSYTFLGGEKRKKSEKIFDILGEVDKLNTALGLTRAFSSTSSVKEIIYYLQEEILLLGSLIALGKNFSVFNKKTKAIEEEIEKIKKPSLKKFIKPGETISGSFFHFSRVICRQLERKIIETGEKKYLPIISFLNRLSLFLFWMGVNEDFQGKTIY